MNLILNSCNLIQKRGIVQLSTPIKKGIYSRYSMGIRNEDGIAAVGLKQKIILKQRKPKFKFSHIFFVKILYTKRPSI